MASPYNWKEELKPVPDMFASGAQVLVNPVNCVGVMGKGLAKQFRDRYPFLYGQYKSDCKAGLLKPGYCLLYHSASDNRWIANIATENDYRNGAKEKWIIEGVRNLREDIHRSKGYFREEYLQSVAIPRIGCGLGGLDWNRIKPLIIKELKGCDFDVWLDGEIFLRNKEGINTMSTIKNKTADARFIWNTPLTGNKDIFQSGAQVLVNPVNCVGAMGKGLALSFKKKFPIVNTAYARDCNLGIYKPGDCHLYHAGNGQWVANVASKDHWKDPSKKEWVIESIRNLRKELSMHSSFDKNGNHFESVAIPKIGCGLGGLDWDKICPGIIAELKGCNFDVWLDGDLFLRGKDGINQMTDPVKTNTAAMQPHPLPQKVWENLPITEKQKKYIESIQKNWKNFKGKTRGEASAYITAYKKHKASQAKQDSLEYECALPNQ